ncbi:metallophosphoesterase [uncultured Methanomethylovorans sp.]|uniref:metallophosphoesterase family protein n=1 Tax=uncultured Methanomethylovorans sp. TaxID=183759 RepID=UPI002AA6F833|nr:metallophosphoesterase [uncultured Methanomethylovorans sp.]
MRIIAISDTHIETGVIPKYLADVLAGYDIIVHAGDFTSYECYEAFEAIGKLKAVHGNVDDALIKQVLPEKVIFEAEGIKIGIVHEGALSINDTTALRYLAMEMEVDILIYGHLHRPLIEKSDVLLICPGSPTKPRMSDPCAVEIEIIDGKVSSKIIEITGQSCDYIEYSRKLAEGK